MNISVTIAELPNMVSVNGTTQTVFMYAQYGVDRASGVPLCQFRQRIKICGADFAAGGARNEVLATVITGCVSGGFRHLRCLADCITGRCVSGFERGC